MAASGFAMVSEDMKTFAKTHSQGLDITAAVTTLDRPTAEHAWEKQRPLRKID